MKIIRSILLIVSFFLSMSFYGQTIDSLQNGNNKKSIIYSSGFSSYDQKFDLQKLNIEAKEPTLMLYNRTTNSYDTYLTKNDSYSYIGSNVIFKNKSNFFTTLFLGDDSFIEGNSLLLNSSSLLLDEDVSYRVRDSFNPNGASNFSEAVLGGVFGLLFN